MNNVNGLLQIGFGKSARASNFSKFFKGMQGAIRVYSLQVFSLFKIGAGTFGSGSMDGIGSKEALDGLSPAVPTFHLAIEHLALNPLRP